MRHVVPVDFGKFPAGFHSERLATPQTGMDSCIAICSRVPAGHHGPKLHTHPADQFYYVMSGEGEISVGPTTVTTATNVEKAMVRKGDSIPIRYNEVHAVRNTGTEPLEFMIVGIGHNANRNVETADVPSD